MATPLAAPKIDERTTPLTADPALSDENKVAHIAPASKITEAYITGVPIEALCGATFVPSRDPKSLPVCEACKEIYEGFILPLRDDHSIKDDV
jgi:Protein of unknown function (DUF3039)